MGALYGLSHAARCGHVAALQRGEIAMGEEMFTAR